MNLISMRFMGVSWRCNPSSIVFENQKSIKEITSVNKFSVLHNCERKNMIISGTGQLVGEDCLQQFNAIYNIFKSGGTGVLAIANLEPIIAVFEKLKIVANPKPNVLEYSFVFREQMQTQSFCKTKHTVGVGEQLWSISQLYNIEIERLLELNPKIYDINEVKAGDVINLC